MLGRSVSLSKDLSKPDMLDVDIFACDDLGSAVFHFQVGLKAVKTLWSYCFKRCWDLLGFEDLFLPGPECTKVSKVNAIWPFACRYKVTGFVGVLYFQDFQRSEDGTESIQTALGHAR